MRLAEAMLLGDTLRKRDAHDWLRKTVFGNYHGCALGGAVLAAADHFDSKRDSVEQVAKQLWPWLTYDHVCNISSLFSSVCRGDISFESLLARVNNMEPEPKKRKAVAKKGVVRKGGKVCA